MAAVGRKEGLAAPCSRSCRCHPADRLLVARLGRAGAGALSRCVEHHDRAGLGPAHQGFHGQRLRRGEGTADMACHLRLPSREARVPLATLAIRGRCPGLRRVAAGGMAPGRPGRRASGADPALGLLGKDGADGVSGHDFRHHLHRRRCPRRHRRDSQPPLGGCGEVVVRRVPDLSFVHLSHSRRDALQGRRRRRCDGGGGVGRDPDDPLHDAGPAGSSARGGGSRVRIRLHPTPDTLARAPASRGA